MEDTRAELKEDTMPTSLSACGNLLKRAGIRHHVDAEDGAIHVVFVTRHYENPRGEHLAIVRLETPEDGRRVRATIARAFPVGDDPAATCLALCRLAADTPLVGVEFDGAADDLRLVAELVVADGRATAAQVASMLDHLVEAAEAWHVALRTACRRGRGAA